MFPKSRIPRFLTPHRFDFVRKIDRETRQHGRIVPSCGELVLYENVPGRWTELREFTENVSNPVGHGNSAAFIYRVYCAFPDVPHQLLQEDFVKVPWGTKPNLYIEPGTPFSPSIWILTPGGAVLMTWDGTAYTGGGYTLAETDGEWCLTGPDIDHCFESSNPLCEFFPDGFGFIKRTGKPMYYHILRYENMLDDVGYYHHTRIEVDCVGTNEFPGQ